MSDKKKPESPQGGDDSHKGQEGGQGPEKQTDRSVVITVVIIVIAILFLVISMSTSDSSDETVDELATSEFVNAVEDDRVYSVIFRTEDATVSGYYWPEGADTTDESELVVYSSIYLGSDSLAELMAEHPDITYTIDTSSSALLETILVYVLPTLLIILVFVYYMRRMSDQNSKTMDFGKTNAKTTEAQRPNVRFSDVAGIDEAVEELQEVKDFLTEPERYESMGAKIPHGILLVGPPGTGKTLLAKAVAGEAGVPFFSISGSDFVEMFVGVGASRVRDLFKQAKESAPCVIFIDEIDAVGRQRGAGLGGGNDEREQTLNQLLVEMDGFEDNSAVILIAATNRPDILDPALLRPGRFDRQVTVDRPDVAGREQILRVHARGKPIADDVDFKRLAKLTPGFTGADLANIMNEAALLAARNHKKVISNAEVEEAMERVMAGPERKSHVINPQEQRVIAYHESGHALVGHILENANSIHKISIVSRGQALGYTMQVPDEDHSLETRNGMLDQIAVLLGGRTAEELFCDDITSGASNDLERATKIARTMVTQYGMSEELGTQVFGEAQHEVFLGRDYAERQEYSAETAKRIDDEVERIMREAHQRAREVLEPRREQMDTMARVLIERETVEGEALAALLDNRWDEYEAAEQAKAEGGDASADTAVEVAVVSTPAETSDENASVEASETSEATVPSESPEHTEPSGPRPPEP